jgi:hypothetical protein
VLNANGFSVIADIGALSGVWFSTLPPGKAWSVTFYHPMGRPNPSASNDEPGLI